ncbi:MAG: MerR family transcriptional regulator [Polaromonas sp.]|nr:MerR family transcriptional regulator [Polaromonas sp.]
MAENFLIGQLAARTGRSVHTIRWYEAQGLIPGVARDSGRRRVYGELHINWLDLMDRLRRTGMSIAEMREYTELVKQGSSTLGKRQALLAAHREQVKDMISEWQQALALLNTKIDFYDEWVASGKRPAAKAPTTVARATRTPRPRRAAKAKS